MHGHDHGVKRDPELRQLKAAALEDDADIVLFGHTHSPCTEEFAGMRLLNPGSVGDGAVHNYGVIVLDGDGIAMELRRV